MESKLVFVLLIGFWLAKAVLGVYDVNTANLLHTSLTFGYNTDLRPSDKVNVSVTLTVDSINFLDFDKKTFSVEGWVTSTWEDSRLTWVPASNGDIEYMFLTKANCWTPTLIIDNELSNTGVLNDDKLAMRVKHDETVTWEQPLVFTVYCNMDSSMFPFDSQTCYISIGTAGYDRNTILLVHGQSNVVISGLLDNAEWSLEKTTLSTSDRTASTGHTYTNLIFNFELKRNAAWYVVNFIFPHIVTSFLGLGVFLIPVESSEKILFTSSVFVVNAILCCLSTSFIPTSSTSTPILGACTASILFLNAIEMILTVMITRIYNKRHNADSVPLSTQAIVKRFKRILKCRFGVEDDQTREILDLTTSDHKKSNALKSKFSVKSQNKVGPSPSPLIATGYQRMQSGADSSPSVHPDVDGRTNLPSNSRYRPSSYTHIRPTSQAQERPSSYTPARPASWKSVAGIQIREKSFTNDELGTNYTPAMNNFVTSEPDNSVPEGATNDVITETLTANANIQKKASEKSNKHVQVPSKATSFRSNRGKDDNEVTWIEVSRFFDMLCLVVFIVVKIILIVVPCVLFTLN